MCVIRSWLTWLWRLISPKICSWVGKLQTEESWRCSSSPMARRLKAQEETECLSLSVKTGKNPMSQFEGSQEGGILSYLWEASPLVPVRPATDWTRPIREGHVLPSTDLNVNLIRKHPHINTWNNVWPTLWAPYGPVKLTHKVKHHRGRAGLDRESGVLLQTCQVLEGETYS